MTAAAWAVLAVLAAGLIGAAYVRLAPTDPARWHMDLTGLAPAGLAALPPGPEAVQPQQGGALAALAAGPEKAAGLLAQLDAIAQDSPRTLRLAGSVEEGRITWQTRSALWGFPDYTTAQDVPQGVLLFARQRFGSEDLGVNAARLRDWLARLPGQGLAP